jgi:hypothetical protein
MGLDLENGEVVLEGGVRMDDIGMETIQLSHLYTGCRAEPFQGLVRFVGI